MSLTDPNQSEDVAPKAAIVDVDVAIPHDDEKETETEQETEQDMIASAMSGDKIKELLTADGPTVKAVLLKTDGTAQQISYDSTPSRNHVADILGAPPSIIGQYVDLDVILVGPRFTLSPDEFPLNTHTLRYPFNNEQFRGDVFLYRFSQQCVVEDFPLSEYEAFAAKKHEDIGRVYQPPQPYEPTETEAMEQTEEDEAFDTEDFMRQIIVKKVRAEFPVKFGREPSDEEVEAFVQATMQKAGAMFGGGGGAMDDIPEEADCDEEDYEPEVDADEAQREHLEDVPSAEQLERERCDIESAQREEAAPRRDIDEKAEEAMVNSAHFEQEMRDALQSVEAVAKVDKAQILRMAREQYFADTGEQPTEDMLADALRVFSIDADEQGDGDEQNENENEEAEAMDEEESSVDAELFAREMAEALSNITRLGQAHQIEFVQKLSDTFCELNGGPPSAAQVSSIFGGIKTQLAEEAKDEFLELKADKAAEDREDEEDEDYVPDAQDLAQQAEDDEDVEEEEEAEAQVQSTSNSRANSVKILVTPVKRSKSGSRVDIYLREQSEEKQNHSLDLAASKFEQINGRAPDESDREKLKEFISTGMLFETETEMDVADEEADEDYSPEKDAFDYSQDAADEASYKAELSTAVEDAENQDTSNSAVVDID